jgi:hypothetical protein
MSRMVDLIKASAVPAPLMQVAARGALSLPAAEMLEVLVFLTHNPVFCNQAKLTLAGWEEKSARDVLSDPDAPAEVLAYFIAPDNIRPGLLPALLENPAVPEEALCILAVMNSREIVEALLRSTRVQQAAPVLSTLRNNPHLSEEEAKRLGTAPEMPPDNAPVPTAFHEHQDDERLVTDAIGEDSEEILQVLTAFERQHAAELAADANKPFQPLGGFVTELELEEPANEVPDQAAAEPVAAAAGASHGAAAAAPARQKSKPKPTEQERISTLQKIAKLDVKGRIHLAVRGSKEERAILIRDGTKLVALAVLESPKISDTEVEGFASQKNVLEAVLRAIPMKRRFAKNYTTIRNLIYNPRTPLDTSLGLMKNLLVNDLKNLAGNKEVSDTIRKMAMRGYRQKTQPGKG